MDKYNDGYEAGRKEMFFLLTSAAYGKQCYFEEENGVIYSRVTGRYLKNLDEAIEEWIDYYTIY